MNKNYPLLILLALFLCSGSLQAQKKDIRTFKKGQLDLDLGMGIFPTFLKDKADVDLPPVNIGGEYWFSPNFTVGLRFGHSTTNYSATNDQLLGVENGRNYQSRYFFSGLRFGMHCTKYDHWDLYGGMTLGYHITHISRLDGEFGAYEAQHGLHQKNDHLTYYGFVGARYSCCNRISFWSELGYGVSILQLGVGYQLL